eukprot:3426852-Rhodomonas_salina.14
MHIAYRDMQSSYTLDMQRPVFTHHIVRRGALYLRPRYAMPDSDKAYRGMLCPSSLATPCPILTPRIMVCPLPTRNVRRLLTYARPLLTYAMPLQVHCAVRGGLRPDPRYPITLRACYALSPYALATPCPVLKQHNTTRSPTSLRACYTMSGTDVVYDATVAYLSTRLPRIPRNWHSVWYLAVPYSPTCMLRYVPY